MRGEPVDHSHSSGFHCEGIGDWAASSTALSRMVSPPLPDVRLEAAKDPLQLFFDVSKSKAEQLTLPSLSPSCGTRSIDSPPYARIFP
jgi:hypothetical protein